MVDLGGERHRWCFERKILWKRKLEIKRASLVRAVRRSLYRTLPVKQITLDRLICDTLDRVYSVCYDYPWLLDGHAHRLDCYSYH